MQRVVTSQPVAVRKIRSLAGERLIDLDHLELAPQIVEQRHSAPTLLFGESTDTDALRQRRR